MKKYDISAVRNLSNPELPYLVKLCGGELIARDNNDGDFALIINNQEYVLTLNGEDARNLAIWLLCRSESF